MLNNKFTKKAFTLIELLVVITIIGILATGGIAVYTSQIKKARDSVRIKDLKVLESAIEQAYQGVDGEYPPSDEFLDRTKAYLNIVPKDKKNGKKCFSSGSDNYCGYAYKPASDAGGVEFGAYELSTGFEAEGNVDTLAANSNDNGDDNYRYEMGAGHQHAEGNNPINTTVSSDGFKGHSGIVRQTDGGTPTDPKDLIIIAGQ